MLATARRQGWVDSPGIRASRRVGGFRKLTPIAMQLFKSKLLYAVSLAGALLARAEAPARLELKSEDHVVLIGNALADRMQHSGWFETLVQARFADQKLVVRNLAVAGDEVAFRHRSENFGSPDDWMKRTGANVVLAFFGFNEAM